MYFFMFLAMSMAIGTGLIGITVAVWAAPYIKKDLEERGLNNIFINLLARRPKIKLLPKESIESTTNKRLLTLALLYYGFSILFLMISALSFVVDTTIIIPIIAIAISASFATCGIFYSVRNAYIL